LEKKWFLSVTLDFDSFVIFVPGSQEGADKGFNPKSIRQKSYHPKTQVLSKNQRVPLSRFRTGSAYTGNLT
jgi:hypothetical protein